MIMTHSDLYEKSNNNFGRTDANSRRANSNGALLITTNMTQPVPSVQLADIADELDKLCGQLVEHSASHAKIKVLKELAEVSQVTSTEVSFHNAARGSGAMKDLGFKQQYNYMSWKSKNRDFMPVIVRVILISPNFLLQTSIILTTEQRDLSLNTRDTPIGSERHNASFPAHQEARIALNASTRRRIDVLDKQLADAKHSEKLETENLAQMISNGQLFGGNPGHLGGSDLQEMMTKVMSVVSTQTEALKMQGERLEKTERKLADVQTELSKANSKIDEVEKAKGDLSNYLEKDKASVNSLWTILQGTGLTGHAEGLTAKVQHLQEQSEKIKEGLQKSLTETSPPFVNLLGRVKNSEDRAASSAPDSQALSKVLNRIKTLEERTNPLVVFEEKLKAVEFKLLSSIDTLEEKFNVSALSEERLKVIESKAAILAELGGWSSRIKTLESYMATVKSVVDDLPSQDERVLTTGEFKNMTRDLYNTNTESIRQSTEAAKSQLAESAESKINQQIHLLSEVVKKDIASQLSAATSSVRDTLHNFTSQHVHPAIEDKINSRLSSMMSRLKALEDKPESSLPVQQTAPVPNLPGVPGSRVAYATKDDINAIRGGQDTFEELVGVMIEGLQTEVRGLESKLSTATSTSNSDMAVEVKSEISNLTSDLQSLETNVKTILELGATVEDVKTTFDSEIKSIKSGMGSEVGRLDTCFDKVVGLQATYEKLSGALNNFGQDLQNTKANFTAIATSKATELFTPFERGIRQYFAELTNRMDGVDMNIESLDRRFQTINTRDMALHVLAQMESQYPDVRRAQDLLALLNNARDKLSSLDVISINVGSLRTEIDTLKRSPDYDPNVIMSSLESLRAKVETLQPPPDYDPVGTANKLEKDVQDLTTKLINVEDSIDAWERGNISIASIQSDVATVSSKVSNDIALKLDDLGKRVSSVEDQTGKTSASLQETQSQIALLQSETLEELAVLSTEQSTLAERISAQQRPNNSSKSGHAPKASNNSIRQSSVNSLTSDGSKKRQRQSGINGAGPSERLVPVVRESNGANKRQKKDDQVESYG